MVKLKNKKNLIVIIAVVAVLVAVAGILLAGRGGTKGEVPDILVKTSFGELRYPGVWKDRIRIERAEGQQGECVSFTAVTASGEAKLFDILFGEGDGIYIGTVEANNGTPVYMVLYNLENAEDWSQEDQFAYYAMQEEVNYVIGHMALQIQAEAQLGVVKAPEQEETAADILIDTPYGQLRYPGKWENVLRLEHIDATDYCVAFYGKPQGLEEYRLFDVYFRMDLGTGLGILETETGEKRAVDLVFYSIDLKPEWTREQSDTIVFMQEAANEMVQQLDLAEIEQRKQTGEPESNAVQSGVQSVQTPYGALEYAKSWGQKMKTRITEGDDYVITFFADIPGRDLIPLFDVVFGQNGQVIVGSAAAADGSTVKVMVNMYELEFSGAWTAEEKDTVYEMAEEINYVLDKLAQCDGITMRS